MVSLTRAARSSFSRSSFPMMCRATSPAAHRLPSHSASGTNPSVASPDGGNVQDRVEQARTLCQLTSNLLSGTSYWFSSA
eukprot:7173062-Pyramimonas_sp.AAC.1